MTWPLVGSQRHDTRIKLLCQCLCIHAVDRTDGDDSGARRALAPFVLKRHVGAPTDYL